jgi:hypothetical protein
VPPSFPSVKRIIPRQDAFRAGRSSRDRAAELLRKKWTEPVDNLKQMTGEHDDFRSLGWLRRHIPMALRVLVQADCPTKEVRHCFLLRDRQGGIGQRRMPIDSAIKMFALAIQTERQAYGLDKPVAQRSKTTVTETSLSVTRELTSDIQEKLQKLSPVSRDIMRQLTAKTLRLLQFQTETFEEGDSDSGNIATPRSPSE